MLSKFFITRINPGKKHGQGSPRNAQSRRKGGAQSGRNTGAIPATYAMPRLDMRASAHLVASQGARGSAMSIIFLEEGPVANILDPISCIRRWCKFGVIGPDNDIHKCQYQTQGDSWVVNQKDLAKFITRVR